MLAFADRPKIGHVFLPNGSCADERPQVVGFLALRVHRLERRWCALMVDRSQLNLGVRHTNRHR
jgi:hypothetical protein